MTLKRMLCMLHHFHEDFSPLLKKLFLLHCKATFILFIAEVLLNIVNGNLPIQSKLELQKFRKEIYQIINNRKRSGSSVKEKRYILATSRGLRLLALIYDPAIKHFS